MNEAEKKQLVSVLADGEMPVSAGRVKLKVSAGVVHIRFCSTNLQNHLQYKFNINKNTLSADFELWICGSNDQWYLLSMSVIRELHEHPDAYEDYQHPGLTVVSVNINKNEVLYARGGISEDIGKYYKAKFAQLA